MRVYLAGPMSGYKAFNIPAFDEGAAVLRGLGVDVISPAEVDGETTRAVLLQSETGSHDDLPPEDGGWSAYLARDREILRTGGFDAIVTLPGWMRSPGANREVGICEGLGIPQYEFADFLVSLEGADELAQLALTGRQRLRPGITEEPWGTGWENDPRYDADGKFITHADNPLRQRAITGAVKDNRGKPRVDLIPFKPLLAVGRVLGFGASKYKPHNWRLGLGWSDTIASSLRHIFAFADGEDIDAESGECHIDNAITQLLFLSEYYHTKTGTDDRWASLSAAAREEAKA